ncbi:MAG: Glycosyl transferase group 1 [Candidatus Giovannonibacteria bacterium GW2011_GWA2_53_7]|uniref:Glycosyl transferase group 1 n=1 Tax=Candidatus Giovannonibacteria bacterium GW2011_GWA2_53_7 TaxID=1618650 RepID=A0A0G2A5B6_9BACT|nr:MAG: Glycosyl transferase group 1 [Candidatus Giovannonibacteria bacterium GW2011_GWA2_53_7]
MIFESETVQKLFPAAFSSREPITHKINLMRIALVHDHLNQEGGAEKVLRVLADLWPEAPLFTLVHDTSRIGLFKDRDVRTSFLDQLPRCLFRLMLPLMPTATESYDLSEFDVVISSSSAFAKGVITKPGCVHICYCHTPTRYLWSDTKEYIQELRVPGVIKWFLPPILSKLRVWDRLAADRVDTFVANSQTVAHRIKKYYRADSIVIHPPVDTSRFSISDKPKTFFLIGGRLVAYKRYDLVIDAFTKLGLPLKVFGTGPMEGALKKRAGKTITFLGRVSDEEQAHLYQEAIAFLHPQEEDFGITPIESMASGRPVIAYRRGGVLESVEEDVTGVFFDRQTWEEIASVVRSFNADRFDPKVIRERALTYSTEHFKTTFEAFVKNTYASYQEQQTHLCE